MQQQPEIFVKANNQKDGELRLSRNSEILLYSLCNGIFATVAFLFFLYFVFRLVFVQILILN